VNLDWGRLRAVVLQSDDWGLCAWVPDEQAHRVLADTPAWRSTAGRVYGRSTLESAADVQALSELLLEFRGGDGLPPVWQANTVMAAPDYGSLRPPGFEVDELPLVLSPEVPSRWQRPGLAEQLAQASASGAWWPELHGLHHVPETTWLHALRRGQADARRAHEQQSAVCEAVEGSGELDPGEPLAVRARGLTRAVEHFRTRYGRDPGSFCPPDYRWDDAIEAQGETLGLRTWQGKAEQHGVAVPRLRRWILEHRWPHQQGVRFYLPPRIAFEPRGRLGMEGRLGGAAAHRAVRAAWSRGQPAVISTHRVNYVHLDQAWCEAGRGALRDLLARLCADGAVFVVDAEVRSMVERAWSVRPIGDRGSLLRYYGVPREPVRFAAPAHAARVVVAESRGPEDVRLALDGGEVIAQVNPGEYLLEWRAA
jgi:hypothetical protein